MTAATSIAVDRPPSPARSRRIALVLGGGGMKGFAHIGVMQALEERGIVPTLYAGTSIGAHARRGARRRHAARRAARARARRCAAAICSESIISEC